MLAIIRIAVFIGLSLSAFVPVVAAPVRLSSPQGVYTDVIQTGAVQHAVSGAAERSAKSWRGLWRAPRAEHPSPALLHSYEGHHGTYSDKPRALWNQEAAPPLAVEQHRTVEDRVRVNCNQHRQSGLLPPVECLCRAGLMTGAACAH
jgi:hypothetical protein